MNYKVTARRWDRGWELHVTDVGVTQTRSLVKAERDVRDYIELVTGSGDFTIDLHVDLGRYAERVNDVRERQQQVADMQVDVGARSRRLIADMGESGLTQTDIARVLSISPQRVSQLKS